MFIENVETGQAAERIIVGNIRNEYFSSVGAKLDLYFNFIGIIQNL